MVTPYLTDNLVSVMLQVLPTSPLVLVPNLSDASPMNSEGDDEQLVQFSNRARRSHKQQLTILAKRTFKSEQYHLEKALAAYFAQQAPQNLLPLPDDE